MCHGYNYVFYLNLNHPEIAYSTGNLFSVTVAFNAGSAVSLVTSVSPTIGFETKSLNPWLGSPPYVGKNFLISSNELI